MLRSRPWQGACKLGRWLGVDPQATWRERHAGWKRRLPIWLTLALTAAFPLGAAAGSQTSQLPEAMGRRVGVWLTNSPSPLYYDASRIDAAVQELAATGFNTIYPNVWSRGTTFHASPYAPIEPELQRRAPGLDPICRITRTAQRSSMQVIPWFEYGLMEPADAEVVRQHPDWVLQRADGSSLYAMHGANLKTSPLRDLRVWLNPAHPGVRQRFIGLIREIVQRCGVDGIQLDDHFAWPVELGYDPTTVALYRQETGNDPPAAFDDRFWMRWRRQKLTALLRELRAAMEQVSGTRRTVISLSPGPFRFAYNQWLQDWELWALGGLIDDLVVQNYAYSVKGFARDLDQPALVKARGWGIPVEIGVLAGFGGRTPDMATLAQKVQLAAARGHGIIYFYWEGLWGQYAGPEGASYRRQVFQQLHQVAFGAAPEGASGAGENGGAGWRPPPPPAGLGPPPPPPPLQRSPAWSHPWFGPPSGLPPLP
ncbi:MAG: glycoside hydrolase family 10 protein [Synechococcaceae cyanobacterium]